MPDIFLSETTYKRLEALASGFTTPEEVIVKLLDNFSGNPEQLAGTVLEHERKEISNHKSHYGLEILYYSGGEGYPKITEEQFKAEFLRGWKAYVKIHFTDAPPVVKPWDRRGFTKTSSVKANLKGGRLDRWEARGIYKAEVSTNPAAFERDG